MKWFLFWAIAATANMHSQPTVSFDTKADCQRYAASWHDESRHKNMAYIVQEMTDRRLKGEANGEDPESIAAAVHSINRDGAYSQVLYARKFTLIYKKEQEEL